MNLKLWIFLITIFMITGVSAADNQTDMINIDDNSPVIADENLNDQVIVEADDSFKSFHSDLEDCNGTFEMSHDYTYDENDGQDSSFGVSSLVINGNGHVLDGANCKHYFNFKYGNEIGDNSSDDGVMHLTINNLSFKNFNDFTLSFKGKITLNNVNITNCSTSSYELIFIVTNSEIKVNNLNVNAGSVNTLFNVFRSNLTIINSNFRVDNVSGSAIEQNRGQLIVENSSFSNFNSKNGAVLNYKGNYFSIKNSHVVNSSVTFNGGAIIAKFFPLINSDGTVNSSTEAFLIENSLFSNLTCSNDGGVIYIDLNSGAYHVSQSLNIVNSNFTDCTSRYGGAVAIQGGTLNIENSRFINNTAGFEGGAIYSTWANVNIVNSVFSNNTAEKNAGAVYFDKGKLTIKKSNFTGNSAVKQASNVANCIYAHDVNADFSNSIFDNGGISVYADFTNDSKLENITKNDDIFMMDNKDYIVSIESNGIKLNLTKDEVIVEELPSKFDARENGWTTPAKIQGDNDDCWAFATVASIETALRKATGQEFNLSQNYVQRLQLKYSQYGDIRISLTGFAYSGLGYALSWIGMLPSDGAYDDRGLIGDTDMSDARIHVQDAMFIPVGRNDTNELIKRAILKYGAVTVQMIIEDPDEIINSTGEDIAVMEHGIHFISLIGWDDDYVYNNTWTSQFKKGIWITKDSLNGFSYEFYDNSRILAVDYYAIVPQNPAIAYIFENDIDYHVNYQTDITGLTGFDGNYTYYSNEFTSKYSELIGAVGTYFNDSGIDYSFDVYVNGELMHSQSGVSEFAGFRTIVLDNYVSVNAGDTFKVVFKSNALPYQAYSRAHYMQGMTFVSADGETWKDITLENRTVCLKVYTVEKSFSNLVEDINNCNGTFEMDADYKFAGTQDASVDLNIPELTINGNGHTIDGANMSDVLNFDIPELTINNLTFKNFQNRSMEITGGNVVFNNVKFIDNSAPDDFGVVSLNTANVTFNNCTFTSNINHFTNVIGFDSNITVIDSNFSGVAFKGHIFADRHSLTVINTAFNNLNSLQATAINFKGSYLVIRNSKFLNMHANLTGGAILGKYFPKTDDETGEYVSSVPFLIENCDFVNVTSAHDGGAIYFDLDSGADGTLQSLNIYNSRFANCSSAFGGTILQLGGLLNIINSTFINNSANIHGGAIYASWVNVTLNNSSFDNNNAGFNAGVIYFDYGMLNILNSNFTNNVASDLGNAIYAYDAVVTAEDSVFENGGTSIFAVFSKFNSKNIKTTSDEFSTDNKIYVVSVENDAVKINLIDNNFNIINLPSKFNLSDWGLVSPVKKQGDSSDCWAFAVTGALESALLKATGVLYNLSENNIQHLLVKYHPNGDLRINTTGFAYSGLGYALSWIGPVVAQEAYDDRGMVSEIVQNGTRIHLQDAMIIFGGRNDTIDLIKQAILKYGSVSVQISVANDGGGESENSTFKIYLHNETDVCPDHFVSIVGWDDNFSPENFNPMPEKAGAWIYKDSLYEGDFKYMSYYDLSFLAMDNNAIVGQNAAIAYIFENTIDYHVNYQTDLTGLTGFDGNYTYYSNEFTSKYSELIGAVGTYFNDSGISYSFDIYVNGKLVHSQTGVSEFAGFRTIILNKYIPVKSGDQFKVVFKNNALPYQAYSRHHYVSGMSMVSSDGESFEDITLQNKTVCLKVYTVADDSKIISNKNIAVDYNGGKYFSVKVVTADGRAVGAGAVVKFTINAKTYTVSTDNNGIAKIKITQIPKKYTIKTSYNGKTYKNTVTVKQVLTANKITIKKKTAKKLVLKAKLKINGKLVKGKVIKFKFKGKTYKVKTNKKGIAQKILKKKVIKKLKKGKTYKVKVIYSKTTIKTTVKVK